MVVLQGDFVQIPEFNLPEPYTYTKTVYPQTTLANLHERIYDASILVLCAFPVDATALSEEKSPHLKLIVIVASGTDCVDLEVCRKRGISVTNCPGANIAAVSEHAIGLYFTMRRRLVDMHAQTRAGEWQKKILMFRYLDKYGDPPLTCEDEVVGIIGNGGVGMYTFHMMCSTVAFSTSNISDGMYRETDRQSCPGIRHESPDFWT